MDEVGGSNLAHRSEYPSEGGRLDDKSSGSLLAGSLATGLGFCWLLAGCGRIGSSQSAMVPRTGDSGASVFSSRGPLEFDLSVSDNTCDLKVSFDW